MKEHNISRTSPSGKPAHFTHCGRLSSLRKSLFAGILLFPMKNNMIGVAQCSRSCVQPWRKVIAGGTMALVGFAASAHADWIQTGAGPFDYLEPANWDAGENGVWNSALTLTAAQTATFSADAVLDNGWTFNYGGNFALTLSGTGADRTVTLGGNVGVNTGGGTTANVTIGNSNAGQRLHVDLGGSTRTFDVATSRTLTLQNNVVGTGGVTKTGAGELRLLSSGNTFVGDIAVNGGTLAVGSDGNMVDSVFGNAANGVSLSNATLRIGTANNRSLLISPLRTITVSGAVSFIGPGGYSNNYQDLNIAGNIVGSGTVTFNGISALLSGNNTGIDQITLNGMLRVSSEANLGDPSSAFVGTGFNAKGFSIMGTELTNLSGHTFPWVTNQGITWDIQDPANTFTWDKNFNIGMNAGTSAGTFTKTGTGTVVVTTAQTYNNTQAAAPDTVMNGGVLKVDYTAGGSLPGSANQLAFGGGTLYLEGKTDETVTQDLGNVKLLAGGGSLIVDNQVGSATTTVNLGDFTTMAAPANGSTLNIQTINPGTGAAVVTSTQANDASGILIGGRIVYNGTDWARIVSGSTVGAYSGYTVGLPASGDNSGVNYRQAGDASVTANAIVNTLKLTTTGTSESLDIASGQTLTLASGGLLFAGADDYLITGGNLAGGQATASDLIIQQYGVGTLTIGSVIANGNGASTLTIAGTGKVVLTNANTYTGQTFVNGATLSISSNTQLNNGANTQLNLNAGTLQATDNISTGRAVALGGGGGTFDVANGKTLTASGTVSGGRLTLNNSDGGNGVLVISKDNNSFSGGVAIDAGVLRLGHNNALGTMGFNTLSFGSTAGTKTLQINGARSIIVAGLNSSVTDAVVENGAAGAATLRVYNGWDNTYAGVLRDGAAGTLAFEKGGGETLTFSGTNAYTGTTFVSSGTLLVNGTQSGGGAYSVKTGATLGGTGTIGLAANTSVTVESGGKLLASSANDLAFTLSGTGILDVSGALGTGTGSMVFTLAAPDSTVVSISGGLNIGTGVLSFTDFSFSTVSGFGEGTYTLFGGASSLAGNLGSGLSGTVGGMGATISLSNFDVILTVVPEPETWGLLTFGLMVVLFLRRRRTVLY